MDKKKFVWFVYEFFFWIHLAIIDENLMPEEILRTNKDLFSYYLYEKCTYILGLLIAAVESYAAKHSNHTLCPRLQGLESILSTFFPICIQIVDGMAFAFHSTVIKHFSNKFIDTTHSSLIKQTFSIKIWLQIIMWTTTGAHRPSMSVDFI